MLLNGGSCVPCSEDQVNPDKGWIQPLISRNSVAPLTLVPEATAKEAPDVSPPP